MLSLKEVKARRSSGSSSNNGASGPPPPPPLILPTPNPPLTLPLYTLHDSLFTGTGMSRAFTGWPCYCGDMHTQCGKRNRCMSGDQRHAHSNHFPSPLVQHPQNSKNGHNWLLPIRRWGREVRRFLRAAQKMDDTINTSTDYM